MTLESYTACTTKLTKRLFVLGELGRTAAFYNKACSTLFVTKFDSYVICDGKKADFVIANESRKCVVLELKGRNVDNAADQIINTANHIRRIDVCSGDIVALVVCARVPLGTSTIQRLVAKLKSCGVRKVKVKTREWHGCFDDLFTK